MILLLRADFKAGVISVIKKIREYDITQIFKQSVREVEIIELLLDKKRNQRGIDNYAT